MLSLIVAGAFSGTFVTLFLWYVFHFTVPEALFWSFAAMAGSVVLNHLTGLVSRAITFWAGTYKDPKKEARVREIIRKFIPAYAVPSGLEVRILKDDTENAFALGRNIVAVNTGLLVRASEEEIAGVIGHELGHLYYKDSVRSAVAFAVLTPGLWALWLLSFLVALGVVLFFVLLFRDRSGIIGSLVFGLFALANFALYQLVRLGLMKNSRDCEYRADAFSARLNEVTRLGLLSWLERHRHRGEADRRSLSAALFSSHPAPEERIARIKEMAV